MVRRPGRTAGTYSKDKTQFSYSEYLGDTLAKTGEAVLTGDALQLQFTNDLNSPYEYAQFCSLTRNP